MATFKHPFQARQGFIPEEFGVRHEPGVVIQEAEQMGAAFLARLARIGQPRTDHRIPLPERVGMVALEAAEGARGMRQQPPGLARRRADGWSGCGH